ncbi:DUF1236 domain-containing protein [Aquibium sp. ELW1220]|uniref:DUF1236 domain-containing protein n=1 Tax=Aquibium sp. ELW1220 TaxID=2976766 RepID=UPI0025AF617A|nr:DUF1236 domain-containing protein [Aquibium sp. ELW1220]MDN2580334.1 DUF1236 domain-containing protein [Aquibium sp. ELW1220]
MKTFLFPMGALALAAPLAFATPAFAQFSAVATTDLNIRSGPGPQYEVVGSIGASQSATVNGCLEGSRWCEVSHNGVTGWSYSEYLAGDFGGERVVISSAPATVEVPVVDYEQTASTNAAVGAAGGAITGALIGGPVGAAIGGVAGAAAGAVVTPPDAVRTYVVENRTDPVYLDGEVVVGAGLPDTVELREVPDYEYRYRHVNGQPVLVDPATRRIVYVYR